MRKLFGIAIFLTSALVITTVLVLYARGYRFNLTERSIKIEVTGIVSIRSNPSGAQVFINGESKGNTNLDISNLNPGKYTIKITKEGFSPWKKEVSVKKEVVNLVEVDLFPIAPNLNSLTSSGVSNQVASPDMTKIIFSVYKGDTDPETGIWSLNLSNLNLPLFFPKDLTKVVADTKKNRFSSTTSEFSPDGKQILVKLADPAKYFLLDISKLNENPGEVTNTVEKIKADWNKQSLSENTTAVKNLGKEAETAAAGLTNLIISPDKKRFIGVRANGTTFVFDGEPAPPTKKPQIYDLPTAKIYVWYPDNMHVILENEKSISIIEIDGTNNTCVYTGNFEPNFIVPWPDGSKLVIVTSLNSTTSKLPNLYAIELR